jgi:hypothetical protein
VRDTHRDLAACFTVNLSQTRVSQFASKLVEERRRVVHVASSRRSCEDEVEDGLGDAMACIRLFYPNLTVFVVLGYRGILVCLLGL